MSRKSSKLRPWRHLLLAGVLLGCYRPLAASVVGTDSLLVSTCTGQSSVSGITLSSYVFLVPGSSLTLQGAGGYITEASSLTVSAVFGDGSHLGSLVPLVGTNTFSGANTFVSSLTLQTGGLQIILSTSTSSNNLAVNQSGAVSFFPELHNSSHTVIPQYQTTVSTFGPCAIGSTVTITTSGGAVELTFTGVFNTGGAWTLNFLQDGQFTANLSSMTGIGGSPFDSFPYRTGHFSYLLDPPSAGSHSYCLTMKTASGTHPGPTLLNDSTAGNIFYVLELK